jgi:hypothetical protein
MRFLLSPDPADPNGPPAPPAAEIVITGTKSEAESKLETDLKSERDSHARTAEEKKAREIKISELEDELTRLRKVQSAPVKEKSNFRTLLHEDED